MTAFGSTGPIIGVSYTPSVGDAYNFQIDNFGSNAMPRSYFGAIDFSNSANGTSIMGGPAYPQRYQWVISTMMETTVAESFDSMFRAWDTDRSDGKAAALGISDETWGATVTTSAVFVTAPTYTRINPQLTLVSFGLQEV